MCETTTVVASEKEEEEDETTTPKLSEEEELALRRGHVVDEILQSEKTHLAGLRFVVERVWHPLREAEILRPEQVATIFCNIEEVAAVAEELAARLETRILSQWDETDAIGDVFLRIMPLLTLKYSLYVANHDKAIKVVNELSEKRPKFAEFLRACKENPESGGRDLLAYLITPVQRLLRYALLLRDYVRCTPPEHPDRAVAQEVLAELDKQAAAVNDSIKRDQNSKKLREIVSRFVNLPSYIRELLLGDHFFVREGWLTKVCRKSNLRRYFWLFTDCLVYGSSATTGFLYHRHFSVTKMRINPIQDNAEVKNGFQVITSEKSFTVMADSREEKEFWVMDLGETINGTRSAHSVDSILTHEKAVDNSEAPVWIPDHLAPRCMICGDSFTVYRRRHHCRNCGKVICGSCSSHRRVIPNLDLTKPERVCDFCDDFFSLQGHEGEEHDEQQKKKKKDKGLLSAWRPDGGGSFPDSPKRDKRKDSRTASQSATQLLPPASSSPREVGRVKTVYMRAPPRKTSSAASLPDSTSHMQSPPMSPLAHSALCPVPSSPLSQTAVGASPPLPPPLPLLSQSVGAQPMLQPPKAPAPKPPSPRVPAPPPPPPSEQQQQQQEEGEAAEAQSKSHSQLLAENRLLKEHLTEKEEHLAENAAELARLKDELASERIQRQALEKQVQDLQQRLEQALAKPIPPSSASAIRLPTPPIEIIPSIPPAPSSPAPETPPPPPPSVDLRQSESSPPPSPQPPLLAQETEAPPEDDSGRPPLQPRRRAPPPPRRHHSKSSPAPSGTKPPPRPLPPAPRHKRRQNKNTKAREKKQTNSHSFAEQKRERTCSQLLSASLRENSPATGPAWFSHSGVCCCCCCWRRSGWRHRERHRMRHGFAPRAWNQCRKSSIQQRLPESLLPCRRSRLSSNRRRSARQLDLRQGIDGMRAARRERSLRRLLLLKELPSSLLCALVAIVHSPHVLGRVWVAEVPIFVVVVIITAVFVVAILDSLQRTLGL